MSHDFLRSPNIALCLSGPSFNNEVLKYCFMSGPLTLILFYFVTACGSPAAKSELGAEIIMF